MDGYNTDRETEFNSRDGGSGVEGGVIDWIWEPRDTETQADGARYCDRELRTARAGAGGSACGTPQARSLAGAPSGPGGTASVRRRQGT